MKASERLALENEREAAVFALIERAAAEGRRCPRNAEIAECLNRFGHLKPIAPSSVPGVVRRLTRQGLITVRVYGRNWRDVTIMKGQHAGKTTLPPPHGGKPHLVIDAAERKRRDKRGSRS